MSKKREIIRKVSALPPLPEVVMKLREYCNDDNVGYDRIAKIVEQDPALTSSLLRLANSAYFGGSGTIGSVQLAMTRLGLKRVYQMALTVSVAPMASVKLDGYKLSALQLWEHSLATAMTAELLAEQVRDVDPGDAYTAGLLHDMGKLVLSEYVDVDIDAIQKVMVEDDLAFDEAEHAVLGVDHAALAGALLKRWQIPADVADAVHWHHRPGRSERDQSLVDVVHIGDVLCLNMGWGIGADGMNYRLDDGAVGRVGVNIGAGEAIVARVMIEMKEMLEQFPALQEA
ncbi:HDOD domain-containing protein [bacterium]|nr:HDOD domain-containing protein [bacterium]